MTSAVPFEVRRFRVDGMHCASCVSRVEALLEAQPGVLRASVNLALEQAQVEGRIDEDTLSRALDGAGFGLRSTESDRDDARDGAWLPLAVTGLATLPVVVFGMSGDASALSVAVQAGLGTAVALLGGAPFHRRALASARQGHASMDTLVSLGTLAALALSGVGLVSNGPLYFESAAVITAFVRAGRFLEARARERASSAIAQLGSLTARDALVLRDGVETRVAAEDLRIGDTLVLRPGQRVPADAVVLEGTSEIHEAAFTGEALPRAVTPGAPLAAGSMNGTGRVLARAERVGAATELAGILQLVAETQASKAPVQRRVDRIASVFVPIVLLVAIGTALASMAFGLPIEAALSRAIAVLVIACPCALGLATPTAVSAGSGRGAELGILFKNAAAFERARNLDAVVFDKTGTLTTGAMRLHPQCRFEDDALGRAIVAVEGASEHAIARALVAAGTERGIAPAAMEDFRAIPGCGAEARIEGHPVAIGQLPWLAASGCEVPAAHADEAAGWEARGQTVVGVAQDQRVRRVLAVGDTLRRESRDAVEALQARGLPVSLLSGDGEGATRDVAEALGIRHFEARVRPADKRAHIAALQEAGHAVAFVGDGINDAAALEQADLGLAMGSGTDVAAESGDALLLRNDPRDVANALALATRTDQTIRQNLVWAFAYNVAAIPLAALGALDPGIAAGAMALSSVSVVANSLRLRRFRPAR